MSRKIYPKSIGICAYCGGEIIAINGNAVRPWRKYCSRKCSTTARNKAVVWTEERRSALSKSKTGQNTGPKTLAVRAKMSAAIQGENHWNWQGGKSGDHHLERGNFKLKMWRRLVLERDHHTCQDCDKTDGLIDAHHIKSFMKYPELRYDLSNGRTLCRRCHARADNKSRRLGRLRI